MSPRLRTIVTAVVIAAATLLLYLPRLGPPPPRSADEEAIFREARSVAETGRDGAGRLAPLFFQVSEERWLQPIPVYATAAVLAVSGTGEWGARFSTVRVAALCALLTYLVARRLFRREWLAIASAALIVLTPALFAHARVVGDAPYSLPFVLVWLYCVLAYLDRPRMRLLVIAGVALGLGVYTQPGAPLTMAFLGILTVPMLTASGHRAQMAAAMAGGFVLPLLVMVPWYLSHPDTYRDTMGRWAILQAHIRFPLDGLRAFVNWTTLGSRASFYWGFFDPSWLFFFEAARPGVLRGSAPFLMPLAVLVPAGIARCLSEAAPLRAWALIGGLVIAPLAASTLGEPHNIAQSMPIAVFAALLAGLGLEYLITPGGLRRAAAFALLAFVPIQFAMFYFRYFAS